MARRRGCRAAGLRGCGAAGLRGCGAAGLQGGAQATGARLLSPEPDCAFLRAREGALSRGWHPGAAAARATGLINGHAAVRPSRRSTLQPYAFQAATVFDHAAVLLSRWSSLPGVEAGRGGGASTRPGEG